MHTSLFSFAYGFTSLEVEEPEEAPCEKQFLTIPLSAGSFTQLSEPPPTEWNQTYGGAWDDVAYSVVQTEDGGYALAGYTRSFSAGHYDCWLVKTDAAGNEQWNQTYSGMNDGWAWSVVQTEDGGYALAGPIWPIGSDKSDFWLVKTDSNGNTQWDQTYGGNEVDYAYSAVQTSDGGYAIAGETASFGAGGYDCWLVKTDSAGNMEWNQTYGGTSGEGGQSIVQTSDGGYAIAGYTNSFDAVDADFYLVKTAGRMPEETRLFFNVNPNPATVGDTLRLKGILLDESSQPLASEMVRLYARRLAGSWQHIKSLTTNAFGVFTWQATVPKVPAGAYILAVYYPGSAHYEASYNFALLIIQ